MDIDLPASEEAGQAISTVFASFNNIVQLDDGIMA